MSPSSEKPQRLALLAWTLLGLFLLIIGGIQVECFLRSADMDVRIYYDAAMALRTGQDMFAAWNPDHPLTYIYPPLLAAAALLTHAETAALCLDCWQRSAAAARAKRPSW